MDYEGGAAEERKTEGICWKKLFRMDYQDDLVVSLPMLEFDVSLNVEEECNSVHSEDMEDFDVFAAGRLLSFIKN